MWDRVLVRIRESLADTPDGTAGSARVLFICPRGCNLVNKCVAAQLGIHAPCQRNQTVTDFPLSREINFRGESLPGASSQCVEIMTAL